MSIKKANEFYEQLDRNQQQFIQNKEINATYSIRKWLAFLSKAVAYDTYADKAIKTLKNREVGFALGIFAGIVGTFFLIYLAPVPVILLILFLRNRKIKNKFKGRNLNNFLRLFFFPVLDVLKDKAGEDAKLAASLNFNDPRQSNPVRSKKFGRNIAQYEATYILSKVILKDQSTLEFVIGDLLKDLSWTKRSASGKTKYKSKSKVAHLCIIKLSVLKSKYSLKTPPLPPDVIAEEKDDLIVLKKKIKIKRVGKDFTLSPKVMFDGLHVLYSSLINPQGESEESPGIQGVGLNDLSEEAMVAALWTGGYFDDYDYDSFDYQDTHYSSYDDESGSIFDS